VRRVKTPEESRSPLGVDGLLLDMDGVLTVSWDPLPGAVEAIAAVRAAGVPMRVLTNTTSRSRAAIASELRRTGFEFADGEVLTAAVAAATYLRSSHPGERVFVLGDAQIADLEDVRLVGLDDQPDVVVISGADPTFTFDTLNQVYRVLLGGPAFVAMHRTLSWMTREGECLDAGVYVLGLERALGREAVITGKPAPQFFAAGLLALGLPAARVGMVGDDVDNDVLAAQATGITGVLVRTGKFREDDVARAGGSPDHVIDSIADLPRLLGL
jgi:HAD superfamily hydrolase (TIGR01458 family)